MSDTHSLEDLKDAMEGTPSDASAPAAEETAADCDAARRWRTAAASFWRMADVALQSRHGSVTLMP